MEYQWKCSSHSLSFNPITFSCSPFNTCAQATRSWHGAFLVLIGVTVFFIAGVRIWKFVLALAATGVAIPIVWSMLRTYQQKRILTFFNPEIDPLGAGYHILQSKIALGSAAFLAGFMQGSQSYLNFSLRSKLTLFLR